MSVTQKEESSKNSFWKVNGGKFIIWLSLNLLTSSLCLIINLVVAVISNSTSCGFEELWNVVNDYAYDGGFASVSISSVMTAFYLVFVNLLGNRLSTKKAVVLICSLLLFTLDIILYTCTLFPVVRNSEFHLNGLLILSVAFSLIISILAFVMTHKE